MSAEDMRNELEAFVNRGLEEGWCGWPTKRPLPDRRESMGIGRSRVTGFGRSVLPRDWWFPRMVPARPSDDAGELSYCDFLVARRVGGSERFSRYFG